MLPISATGIVIDNSNNIDGNDNDSDGDADNGGDINADGSKHWRSCVEYSVSIRTGGNLLNISNDNNNMQKQRWLWVNKVQAFLLAFRRHGSIESYVA